MEGHELAPRPSQTRKHARANKIAIGIENVWNKFPQPVEMRDFIDQFKSEYVGSYFDVGNCLVNGYPSTGFARWQTHQAGASERL